MELLDPLRQPTLQDGNISEHYEVRRLLGEGGFGHVFEAWDTKLCRSVALKRLKPQADVLHPEKLINEARLAASLRHAAFVRIFSIEGQGTGQSIVMELVEGQTLGQFMHSGAATVEAALDIGYQIADAMDEAHAMDLVHGDLKPSNLMLEANGKVRILDFGLARHMDPQATQTTALCDLQGTIAYMAPERLMGRLPDTRGDVYALGAMLYEMLAGQRHFAHLNGLALAAAHMQATDPWPDLPDTVPPAINALVRAMTAHDPGDRPRTMRDVRDAIGTQRGEAARSATPLVNEKLAQKELPATVSIQLPIPRKRTLKWGAAIALLAVLAGWQLPNVLPVVKSLVTGEKAPQPYSEMASMAAGMEALRVFDRDTSQRTAIEEFSKVLEHNPSNAAAAAGLSLASSLRYTGNGRDETWLQRADVSAKQALAADNQLALSHVAQAWVYEIQGKNEEALREATISLNLEPNNLLGLYGKARLYIISHKFESAHSILEKAIAAYPQERLFNSMLGYMYYKQGDYVTAEKIFRNSIRMDPQSPSAYASLNATLLRQNRGDEALQVLQQGLQIHPHWELYTNLGTSLFAKGDYLAAVQAFENAVSEKKGSPGTYLLWANLADAQRWVPAQIKLSRKSYSRAIELLSPMLARMPNDITMNSRMALYQAYVGEKKQALNIVKHAVNLAPQAAEVQFRAALTYELINNRSEALNALIRASKLGYPLNLIESAPDLLNLRRDARYQQFLITLERDNKK
ncbi:MULTISPECIES: serine/threonine-protein kinase [unclassified Janthinobacterium]|uniref:serine/threonine-protein kinase n=1 Tax=unclassified Janthinobacterium TaxID=2610881 RepID=UPI001611E4F0|nr:MULTISPECIES: serine/threonine-protein kinase [unclassified Janthinobacterium]MBB5610082.1 serine/threonine-protein kinase [Janthinobacterium sp. S3T4]MBB5615284.1 serine/threonine-protein kinase [Janthinobacterium sp. S3M3]